MRTTIGAALLAATALCALPAAAEDRQDPNIPVSMAEDRNMRTIAYRPGIRVRLVGNPGRATAITFGPNEKVKRVIFGDATVNPEEESVWSMATAEEMGSAPLLNHLHLWANRVGYTNIVVITQVDEGAAPDRPYQFAALVQNLPAGCLDRPDVECDDPKATYGLTFLYPDQERQRRAKEEADRRAALLAQARERARVVSHETARARLAVDHYSGGAARNWCWEGVGDRLLAPDADRTSDNRQEFTTSYGGRPVPAFMSVRPDGGDGEVLHPVMRDGIVVLPSVPDRIRTRMGGLVLDLVNCAEEKGPVTTGTHTTRPDVFRRVRAR